MGAAAVPARAGPDGGLPEPPDHPGHGGGQEDHQELQQTGQDAARVRGALPPRMAQTGTYLRKSTQKVHVH